MSMTLANTVLGTDATTTLDESAGVSLISTFVAGGIMLGSGGYADSLTITSTGTVSGTYGGDISGSGTVVNYGVLEGVGIGGGGINLFSGTIINRGEIIGGSALGYGTFINSGLMSGHGGFNIKNGLVIDSGVIKSNDLPAIIAVYGLTLVLEPGFGGGTSGDSGMALVESRNGTLIPSAGLRSLSLYGFAGFSNIDVSTDPGITLNASVGWLEGLGSNEPTLAGFQPGDTLLVANAASYVSGEGIVAATVDGMTATIALNTPLTDGLAFTLRSAMPRALTWRSLPPASVWIRASAHQEARWRWRI